MLQRHPSRIPHLTRPPSACHHDRACVWLDDRGKDLMMGVVFIALEGLRRAGVADLKEAILTEEADAFKNW